LTKLIGIDTGGTYTDAVVFDEAIGVIAKAKSLTTHRDLSVGIGNALDRVMAQAALTSGDVALVSASTTLATNAIVGGLGDRVGLVLIGFSDRDLTRAGLREALGSDRVIFVAGGHTVQGTEAAQLDLDAVKRWAEAEADRVSAFAVAAQFATANPAHELAARAALVSLTGKPVTCGHELSARLNAPRRALTALLNARLIGILQHLIDATEGLLDERSILAPLMVVKGDGSLMSAAEARRRPIETILSGPAASLVGASYLTGARTALVSDIGGTTTDIALLRDGQPRLDPEGARVAGWSTMVEAVAVRTIGLGGDSDVEQNRGSLGVSLQLGPRRVVPVSLLAAEFAAAVHEALDRHARLQPIPAGAGRFAITAGRRGAAMAPEDEHEAEILRRIADVPAPILELAKTRRGQLAIRRLVDRGAVLVSAFCPSDAAHVLGLHQAWDRDAAIKAASLFASRRTRLGGPLAESPEEISRLVIETLTGRSVDALIDAASAEDGEIGARASADPFIRAALARRPALVSLEVRLAAPIVALGASARIYYGAVAERLRTEALIPEHADVANAVGAVVGQVRAEAIVTISRGDAGGFRAHLGQGPADFAELAPAVDAAERFARAEAVARAAANGAENAEVSIRREENSALVSGESIFLEMRVVASAIGRPAFAQRAS
jgi:N-methylhydantoinase A/oxoprolinase/acetone carboxylase beta subunit